MRCHMADFREGQAGKGCRKGIYDESVFVYDAKGDTYRCPAGQILTRRRHKKKRHAYEYTAGPKTCAACHLRQQCTRSKAGRSIKRHEKHEAIEAARAQSHSAAAKRDRRRRKHLMEGSFADATNNHGFKRARWRRLWKQRIQDYLIAAAQNIRILVRHRFNRKRAAAEALAVPRQAARAFCRFVQHFRALTRPLRRLGPPLAVIRLCSAPRSTSTPATNTHLLHAHAMSQTPFGQHALDLWIIALHPLLRRLTGADRRKPALSRKLLCVSIPEGGRWRFPWKHTAGFRGRR